MQESSSLKNVGIFCSGKPDIKQEYIDIMSSILRKIDTSRIAIVYGGGSVGLMGVIREVYTGKIISSNMKAFISQETTPTSVVDDYVFDTITQRQSKLIELSDMFIVFPGGFGTVYECLEVITKNQIGEHSKKIIIFNYKGLYNHLRDQIEHLHQEGFIKHPLDYYNIIFVNENEIDILLSHVNHL
jgi:uncharacterized protein (TIGR00730 family)